MMNLTDRRSIRVDLQIIADMIAPNTRVLDVGCGNGVLLDYLVHFKQVDGRGIELSTDGVKACVSMGLSVIQGDADTDIKDYPDGAFDYVVLSHTIQAMAQPRMVLENMLRIGKRAILSFPNFAYWRHRWYLISRGRMPVNDVLPYEWYDTPNIHFCTIRDMQALCEELDFVIEKKVALGPNNKPLLCSAPGYANLLAEQAVFVLGKP